MLRKKNITLNGKKAEGKEKLIAGDTLTLFLSEGDSLNKAVLLDALSQFLDCALIKGLSGV